MYNCAYAAEAKSSAGTIRKVRVMDIDGYFVRRLSSPTALHCNAKERDFLNQIT
jgi:hypothetical protein